MIHKKIVLPLVITLVLGLASIAGATDSGFTPSALPGALTATGKGSIARSSAGRPTIKDGEILVQFKNTMSASSLGSLAASLGGTVKKTIGKDKVSMVSLSKGMSVEQAVRSFSANPNVVHAQPNFMYYPTAAPNDALYGQMWGLHNTNQTITSESYATNNPPGAGSIGNDIDAEAAWDLVTDCSAVIVAVIDTSMNYTHEDLAANMWNGNTNHGWDFVDDDNEPMATDGQIHGSHVAGTIGARGNNLVGTSGVCRQVQIMAVRVLGPDGGFTSDIIQGIEFAANNGAHVINMSLGGGGGFDTLFSNSITYARDRDVVVVVAAGNETNNNDGGMTANNRWPCNFTQDNLICVAALDQAYSLASFSNTGTTSVDVGAPGVNVLSTWPGATINVGTFSDWTLGTGWGFDDACVFNMALGPFPMLMNPTGWCNFNNSQYTNNLDSVAYKEYDLSSFTYAAFSSLAFIDTEFGGDIFSVYSNSGGGDPSAGTTHTALWGSTGGLVQPFNFSLNNCLDMNCSIGYGLFTNGSVTDLGVAILNMEVQGVESNSQVYVNINGTSMASPHVAGIAALVRAYNPLYNYLDTVNAILGGGEAVAALATTTTTGMAANAFGSLTFINTPTGISVTP